MTEITVHTTLYDVADMDITIKDVDDERCLQRALKLYEKIVVLSTHERD